MACESPALGPLPTSKGALAAPGPGNFSALHVLLVDDERLSRTVVANMLRKCNYKVTTAENGAEAMELLRSNPHGTFQLVLTDICMPQCNGIELLQLVKQDDAFRSVPVIMMSSIEQDETVLQCVQGGAEEYLVKPVTKKELQHIWQHVWRKQLASAAMVPQARPAAAAAAATKPHEEFAAPAAAAAAALEPAQLAPAVPPSRGVEPAHAAEEEEEAAPRQQQQQQQGSGGPLPPAVPIGDFILSPAGLDKRLKLFGAAVALLQSCHVHATPLLRLRPYSLGIAPQGLRAIDGAASSQQQQQQQAGDLRAVLDSLYASPEERAAASGAKPAAAVTMAADLFSLGALFVDLFLPRPSMQERCAQLATLQSGSLPAEVAGAGAELAPLQAFLRSLLHPDPRARPMLVQLARSGQLQEVYRAAHLLPAWRTRQQAQQQQQQEQQQQEQQPAEEPQLVQQGSDDVDAGAATASQQAQPADKAAADERAASPAPEAEPEADYDALRQFLRLLREARVSEAQLLYQQLAMVDADMALVLAAAQCNGACGCGGSSLLAAVAAAVPQQLPLLEGGAAAAGEQPPAKRQRTCSAEAAAPVASSLDSLLGQAARPEQAARVDAALPQLEELFFARRGAPGVMPAAELDAFASDLDVLSRRGSLSVKAMLRCGDMASPMEMACCVAFDREDSLFATVGVSRRIKLFDFAACLESDAGVMHYPVMQMATRSKLSSVSWNAYVRQRLVTADYDGLIQLWDAGSGTELQHFDEHARRVWSVDFSRTEPTRFLSGSDDGTVRLWSMHDESSVLQIRAPANVCSVQFSPEDSNLVAFGCANYKVYVYDLRRPGSPLGAISGPQRAVSYVRFMGGSHLVAASTDSTLRLWSLNEALSAGSTAAAAGKRPAPAGPTPPQLCFRGHRNHRNFVGLSVTHDGYIACGSEDNQVHCYYRSLPFCLGAHQFGAAESCSGASGSDVPPPAHPPFVSAVCWANRSRHLLAANSQGIIQVLQME